MSNTTKILIKKLPVALAVSTLFAVGSVNAADFDFSGNIANHNDVIRINFSLASDAANVDVWTNSFQNAVNFDPITSVWVQSGSDYTLVGQNDDNASIRPDQTYYDSGLTFASLAAGNYLFSIGTYANFAAGTLLSEGFAYDGQAPIPLSDWCQPASHCGMGTFYDVHLSGVDSAQNNTPGTPVSAVPEPQTYAMLLGGLGLLGFMARRREDFNF